MTTHRQLHVDREGEEITLRILDREWAFTRNEAVLLVQLILGKVSEIDRDRESVKASP